MRGYTSSFKSTHSDGGTSWSVTERAGATTDEQSRGRASWAEQRENGSRESNGGRTATEELQKQQQSSVRTMAAEQRKGCSAERKATAEQQQRSSRRTEREGCSSSGRRERKLQQRRRGRATCRSYGRRRSCQMEEVKQEDAEKTAERRRPSWGRLEEPFPLRTPSAFRKNPQLLWSR